MALLVDAEVLRRQLRGALKNVVDQHGPVDAGSVERVAGLVVSQLAAMDRNFVPDPGGKRERKVRALLERDGDGCFYCSVVLDWWLYTFDHWVPRCRGGTSAVGNLRLACRSCNGLKGAMDGEAFRAFMAERSAHGPDELEERRIRRRANPRPPRLTQPLAEARGAELLSGFTSPYGDFGERSGV